MAISLGRIQVKNVLLSLHHSSRECSYNLIREFTRLSCVPTNQNKCHFVKFDSCKVPTRDYHKHEVEVKKRIQWVRPKRIPCFVPQKSGDLSGLPDIDLSKPPPLFEESEEYKTANDLVKRVLSLRYQPAQARKQSYVDTVVAKVRRHRLDVKSVEAKIARWTVIIRNMQVHYSKFPHDGKTNASLKEIIDFRKKRLKILRSLDYKKFEWLLEQLDLMYKPPPTKFERVERKKSMKWLTAQYVENVRQKKLDEYKEVLNSRKTEFLQSKLATMKAIIEQEKSLGVELSFTSKEIEDVEESLRQRILEESQAKANQEIEKEQY